MAVVISKIARFDCPQNWPELIPQLANTIDGSVAAADTVAHERALFILYYVVKMLASKRLANDKRVFHEVCPFSYGSQERLDVAFVFSSVQKYSIPYMDTGKLTCHKPVSTSFLHRRLRFA